MTALPGNGRFRNFSTEIAMGDLNLNLNLNLDLNLNPKPTGESVEKFLNRPFPLNPV